MSTRTLFGRWWAAALLCATVAGGARAETIENRDGKSLIATWWGADSVAPFVYTLDFGNTQRVHSAPYSLRFDYDKANHPSNANSFVSAMGRWNFRNYDYLSFWVYNSGTPLRVRIRLEDKNGNPWESNWANIEPQTTTTNADWENLTVDLTRSFAATNVDFTAIQQLMFIVAPDDQGARGTFWLDDVELTRSPNQAPLEPFESDFYGWSGGGVFASMTNTTEQFQNSGGAMSLGQKSLKISWGSKAANYDNFTYTTFHDPAAPAERIGRYTNFTLNGDNTVELWVKSTTDNNLPILMKFSGSSGTSDVATMTYTGAGAWQRLAWNFSTQAVIASRLQTVWIFPYPNQADGGGTLYIDNLGLAGGTGPVIPHAPTSVWTTATAPDGDGVYTVRWSSVTGITDYQVHESTNVNFTTFTTIHTNQPSIRFAKSVPAAGMTYYYRIASRIVSGGVTNIGCFTPPAIVTVKTIPSASRRYEILDNFDGQKLVAAWWGSDAAAPYCYAQDFANTQRVHRGTRSLRIDYDKSNDTNSPYSFFSAMGSYNLRNFDFFSFWVYNSGSVVRFRVRLEDDQARAWESNWANIEPTLKTAAADWENLVVDLTRTFSAHMITNINMEKITQVMFMIEPGSITNRGTLWMDDLEFHRAPNSAPLEVFESDSYGWAAGGPFSVVTSTVAFRNDGTQTGLGQQSLRVTWTNKPADYSNFGYTLAHDPAAAPAGRIGRITNLAQGGDTFAELWAYSATETNLPILLKLDGADVSIQNYTTPGAWQRLTWDFSQVPNRASVTTMVFYPFPNSADAGGTLYLDDLSLAGGTAPAVPYAPTSLAVTVAGSGNVTVSWNSVAGVSGYHIQESTVPDFSTVSAIYTSTTTRRAISKSPYTEAGTYYYRVRSYLGAAATNVGSFSQPIVATYIPESNLRSDTLDGFDTNGNVTAWWAPDGVAPYTYTMDFVNTQRVHSGKVALKVAYDKANDPNGYTFYAALGQYNLRNFDYLSFWIYNTGATVRFNVRLEDVNGNPFETSWAGMELRTKTPGADWENIVLDLSRAYGANNLDMTAIKQIMFMVEPGSTNGAGEFWMDDLQFSRAPNAAPLEPFESDSFGWSAGTNFPMAIVSNQFHNDGTVRGLGQQSLVISWTNKGVNYDNFIYIPAHDAATAPAGRIGNYRNFALDSNRVVELWVRSTTETNMPLLLKFDDVDVGVQNYVGTGQWKRLVWNYGALAGATNVSTVWFFPYPAAADAGGTIYLDDLNLAGGPGPEVPYAPGRLRISAATNGNFTLSWGAVSNVSGYVVQESMASDFATVTATYAFPGSGTNGPINKGPYAGGRFYYRVASYVANGVTNVGSYTAPVNIYLQPSANLQFEKLDSFDQDGNVIAWWAADGVAPLVYNLDFGNTQRVHSGTTSLQVNYDKAGDPNAYTFFAAVGQYNLRAQDYLSFWVYNSGAVLRLNIRLEDVNGQAFETSWAGMDLRTLTPTADWENIVFDLSRLYAETNLDLSAIKQVMFMVAPGSTTEKGTFWMDDIQWSRAVNSAPLEAFEADKLGWISGTNFPMTVVSNQFHNDMTVRGLGHRALQVSWTNKPVGYDNFIYQTMHDAGSAPGGRIGNYPNFKLNGNNHIELWVRSSTETNMPLLLKFDSVDVGVKNYTGGGQWQRLVWDYSGLANATNVGVLWFMPYPNTNDAGGTIFIDDLNLTGGSAQPVPGIPSGLAVGRVTMGSYTVSWNSVTSADAYQLQESMHPEFASGNVTYGVSNLAKAIYKSPQTQYGTYYYRARSGIAGTYGSFGKPVAVYIAHMTTNAGTASNDSYPTDCAEVDNISSGLQYSNTATYRITVTHPLYYEDYGTNVLNERGADFDDCDFTDRRIWIVGTNDGFWWEFKQSGFGNGDVYHPIDNPYSGVDEAWSNMPKEINHDWLQEQSFQFTAEELGDVDLEYKVGSELFVSLAMVNGTLAITASARSASGWVGLGTRTFTQTARTNSWITPDFIWAQGVDTNTLKLRVLPSSQSASQPGSWALYDYVELRKRSEIGDIVLPNLFDNGNVIVTPVDIDFWWRTPDHMTVSVIGGGTTTCDYFRIAKRVPTTNYFSTSQIFVMYEDGNVRLLPHPPLGVDWTPFGGSVILGASPDVARPFAGVQSVVVDPDDLAMDITFDDGGSCHLEIWVDDKQNVVDVSEITYNTSTSVFARFRSMWVCDGKADIDRVETAAGVFPISEHWEELESTWWQFYKESPTYHNTYCPDFRMEVLEPSPAVIIRQCEDYDGGTNFAMSFRSNARNQRVLSFNASGGEATYEVDITQPRSNVVMRIRYSDDDGGNNGDYPGNLVSVYVDGVLKDQTRTMNTAGWDDFEKMPAIYIGNLSAGRHTIRIAVGGLTFGCDLDEFQLVAQPVAEWTKVSVLTRQGEAFTTASNYFVASRSGAVGGQSLHLEHGSTNALATYNFNLATATSNTYIQLTYSDDLGPTKLDLYLDGILAARFPTRDGASWTDWMLSTELYLGTLSAGAHQLKIVCYPETYGADIDQFEIYRYQP